MYDERSLPAIELAFSLISGRKSSPIISHGMGPNPSEKEKIKTHREVRGKNPRALAPAGLVSKM